ncbi:MAG: hypothetical protein FWC41_00330 [Firmicutes bacterium]|nr:hypothetical protein [Bacillota bacterium]
MLVSIAIIEAINSSNIKLTSTTPPTTPVNFAAATTFPPIVPTATAAPQDTYTAIIIKHSPETKYCHENIY